MANSELAKNDEIDLIDLIKILWKKKLTVILSAFLFTIVAAIYAFTAKEKWTSTTEVIEPTIVDMGAYGNAKLRFAQISKLPDITIDTISKSLYAKFDRLAFSLNERRNFFAQSDEYKGLIQDQDEKGKPKILSDLITEDTAVVRPDPKKNTDMFGNRITFSAQTPENAQETLTQFIDFINEKAFELDKNEFQMEIAQQIDNLTNEKKEIEESLMVQKEQNKDDSKPLNVIPQSLPQTSSNSSSQSAQDSALDPAMALLVYGDDYSRMQLRIITGQINQLKALQNEVKGLKAQTYTYQASPSYPVQRDWPKRAILLIVGAVLGGIVGCAVVLVKFFLSSKE
ncbi:Wzz/FepE/Etk N-terminal domain-containing protein [Bisgaard Taxon 10/6]|uniref:LPS O-antigen chain length determinant protein WzzB n=1 Tax=Exercitatus varius TaxID=67857 RepID=UPI00294AA4A7|nr:Wzz/FepE/Etk N-terminal domain-containing protein [Exercitatus varius]MDG2953765.1 Wzz/FepE/Etk N-terminal domain-containing protein [Exercitatus varius]